MDVVADAAHQAGPWPPLVLARGKQPPATAAAQPGCPSCSQAFAAQGSVRGVLHLHSSSASVPFLGLWF